MLLLIEVAESSLAYERGEKLDFYLAARIKDCWIINLTELCIEVYRKPHNGAFRESTTYQVGESVSPLAFPNIALETSHVFAG